VLQCVEECFSELQGVAVRCGQSMCSYSLRIQVYLVCCSVPACVAVCPCVLQRVAVFCSVCCCALQCVAVSCSELQCVALCCIVLQCVALCVVGFAMYCSMTLRVEVCCSVLQCATVRCGVLQCFVE